MLAVKRFLQTGLDNHTDLKGIAAYYINHEIMVNPVKVADFNRTVNYAWLTSGWSIVPM